MSEHEKGQTVRLTVNLKPELHKRVKVKAALEGVTVSDMVRQWLEEWVNE